MIRRLTRRAFDSFATRVLSAPCAVWFGSRVLVIAPGAGMFTLSPDDAKTLAAKLDAVTRVPSVNH